MRLRSLALAGALALLAIPSSASAAVNVTAFSVTPSTTQAGGHPNLTISTSFAASPASDDTKDLIVKFPAGLVGNPNAVPKCSTGQFAADTCPGNTAVGSVAVTAEASLPPLNPVVTSPGTVYNLPPVGDEPARLGIKIRPAPLGPVTFEPIGLVSVAKLGPETGYALETTIPNQPRTVNSTVGPIALNIQKVDLSLRGQPGATPFLTNPSSCAPGTFSTTVVPYDSGAPSTRTAPYTATGCAALPFAPKASGTIGSKGRNKKGSLISLTTTFDFPSGSGSLKDSVVTLPKDVTSNLDALTRACELATPVDSCPAASTIGTAEAATPLLSTPLRGPVVLKKAASGPYPSLVVRLKGAAPLTLEGKVDIFQNRLRNTFPGAPDIPLSKFKLSIDGGKGGLLLAVEDLCRTKRANVADTTLTGWNGKTVTAKPKLAPQGCKGYSEPRPRAAASLSRRGKTLKLRVSAGTYTRLRAVGVTLPKGVAVSRKRLSGTAGKKLRGKALKVKGRKVRVAVSRKGATSVRLSGKRVRVSRKLVGKRVKLRVTARDDTGRTVKLTVRARVRR